MAIETIIFSNLVYNPEYFARVIPYLKTEYFHHSEDRIILKAIQDYADKYKAAPSLDAIRIAVDKLQNLSSDEAEGVEGVLSELNEVPEDLEWCVNETEEYCQRQAMLNALSESVQIKENFDKPADQRDKRVKDIGMIPEIMRDALAVCFDTSVGHDYFDDWEDRWKKYNEKIAKIPCGLEMMNKITNGGVERGTLNVILAGVNVGKSLGLCHLAADYLTQGLNVLYISMEMAEHVVAKRIDANLIDVSMDDFETLGLKSYQSRLERKRAQVGQGRLIIKQYPTAAAHVGHFNALLNELRTKKNFKPDVVMVDYLGICASSRVRVSDNSYHYVKNIAEELRGFAVEHDLVVWTAAQTTRGAWGASDIEMGDTAESAGLPATADFMIAVMETEDTIEMGQQRVKQIKSRYADKAVMSSFMIAVDKGRQRWEDVDGEEGLQAPELVRERAKAPTPKTDGSNLDRDTGEINW